MNPVLKGYVSYSDLKDGTLNLYDLYILNEVIESEAKYHREMAQKVKREAALKQKRK